MVRFELNLRNDQLLACYKELEQIEYEFELRYGIFTHSTTYAEILTYDNGQKEIENVLNKYGIKYDLERVL